MIPFMPGSIDKVLKYTQILNWFCSDLLRIFFYNCPSYYPVNMIPNILTQLNFANSRGKSDFLELFSSPLKFRFAINLNFERVFLMNFIVNNLTDWFFPAIWHSFTLWVKTGNFVYNLAYLKLTTPIIKA